MWTEILLAAATTTVGVLMAGILGKDCNPVEVLTLYFVVLIAVKMMRKEEERP